MVDMRGNLLNRARKSASPDDPEPSEAALDYQQKIEHDLLAKINNTLDPLLGADKFRATVSVDCDFTSAEQSEETFDPSKSVMVNFAKDRRRQRRGDRLGRAGYGFQSAAARRRARPPAATR